MRKILTLFAFVFFHTAVSQVTNLSSLSMYQFLDSAIIYDENGKDVYGYFLLYEKDQINDIVFDLEYVLLDKNLNKVASNSFKQVRFQEFSIPNTTGIRFCRKAGEHLYLSIGEAYTAREGIMADLGVISFRILDLNDYKLSDAFLLKDYRGVKDPAIVKNEFKGNCFMKLTRNNGFIVFDEPAVTAYRRTLQQSMESLKRLQRFTFFDFNLQQKWSYDFNPDQGAGSFVVYRYYTGDGRDMIFKKHCFQTGTDKNPLVSYEVIDAENGSKKLEVPVAKDQYLLDVVDIKFEKEQIIFYAALNEYNADKIFKQRSITGYAKLTYERATGREISTKYFLWSGLADKYDISKYGEIKDYGFLHFQDIETLKDGKTLVVAEGFISKSLTLILDLFVMTFDNDMKVSDVSKVGKFKNSVYYQNGNGKSLDKAGAFDFIYGQNIKDDDYAFYYRDNEKEMRESTENSKWVLGVITYVDGEIKVDKVPLKGKYGPIFPIRAKNGYIVLKEAAPTGTTLRLEKINY